MSGVIDPNRNANQKEAMVSRAIDSCLGSFDFGNDCNQKLSLRMLKSAPFT